MRTTKTSEGIIDVPADIQNEHVPYLRQELYMLIDSPVDLLAASV
jgi:hypothetical protein